MVSGALEASNVNIANEFAEMITYQRGLQANARTITASDEILQTLINL
jgi:flagellar hook protein FlgE